MNKYRIAIKRNEWGFCEVEAENKKEAKEKGYEKYEVGDMVWGKDEYEITDVIVVDEA